MEDQLLFENLNEKLEDDIGPITANWISINFDLTIDNSRRLMKSYLKSRKDLSSVHLLSGISNSGEFLIKMARSDQISVAEKSFKHPPTFIVYSIQRQPCESSISLADNDIIQNLTNNEVEKLLTILSLLITIPWSPQEPKRTPLSCCENQLGQKSDKLSEKNESKKHLESVSKNLTHSHTDRIKTSTVKNFFIKSEKNKESAKPAEPKTETDNSVINKSINKKELLSSLDKEDDEPLINVSSGKRKRVVIESDEDSDSPNEENISQLTLQPKLSSTHSVNKSQMHGRKSESNKKNKNQVLVLDSETDSPTAHSAKPTKKSIQNTHSHVSKIIESETVKKVNPDKCGPKISEVDTRPKHIRHQVMKTFADEDGFMVTEKGWESASDNEDSHKISVISNAKLEPQSNSHSKTNNSTILTGAPAVHHSKNNKITSKKSLPKPGSKQVSLSAFFKPKE